MSMEGSLSYGYPMDMVWLSYGKSTKLVRNWHEFGTILEQRGNNMGIAFRLNVCSEEFVRQCCLCDF